MSIRESYGTNGDLPSIRGEVTEDLVEITDRLDLSIQNFNEGARSVSETIAQLKSIPADVWTTGHKAIVLGRESIGDTHPFWYEWDSTSIATANDKTVIQVNLDSQGNAWSGPGRFLLIDSTPSSTIDTSGASNVVIDAFKRSVVIINGGGTIDSFDMAENDELLVIRGNQDVILLHDNQKIVLDGSNLTLTATLPVIKIFHSNGISYVTTASPSEVSAGTFEFIDNTETTESADFLPFYDSSSSNFPRKTTISSLISDNNIITNDNGLFVDDLHVDKTTNARIIVDSGTTSTAYFDLRDAGVTKASLNLAGTNNNLSLEAFSSSDILTPIMTWTYATDTLNFPFTGATINSNTIWHSGNLPLLDEDNFASNSATAVASQQSIKAYIDAQVFSSSGDVSTIGTPANNELAVWTGDGTLEGESNLVYSSASLTLQGYSSTADGSILILRPDDYAANKPQFSIKKAAAPTQWNVELWDGTDNNGTINFVSSALTHFGNTVWTSGNDGAASGLDADLLDGQQGTHYLDYNNFTNVPVILDEDDMSSNSSTAVATQQSIKAYIDANVDQDVKSGSSPIFNGPRVSSLGLTSLFEVSLSSSGVGNPDLDVTYGSTFEPKTAKFDGATGDLILDAGSDFKVSTNTVWHQGNDGSGSGLDADLLDGQQGSYYLNYNNFTNTPSIPTNTSDLTNDSGYITASSADTLSNKSGNISQWTNDSGYITATLTQEEVEDYVGGMISGNTETLITVTYQDGDGTLDFVVDDDLANYDNTNAQFIITGGTGWLTTLGFDALFGVTISTSGDSLIITSGDVIGGQYDYTFSGTNGNLTIDASSSFRVGTNVVWHAGNDGASSGLDADLLDGQQGSYYLDYNNFMNTPATVTPRTDEEIQDVAGAMVTGNSETRITVTYQDSDGTIDFVVDGNLANYDNTSSGFMTASSTNTLTNKSGNISQWTNDSGYLTSETYSTASELLTALLTVDGASSGLDADRLDGQQDTYYLDYNNFSNTPSIPTNTSDLTNDSGFITASSSNTLTNKSGNISQWTNDSGYITSTLTNEQVQDIVGAMFTTNTETRITATYQDGDGTIDLVVDAIPTGALADLNTVDTAQINDEAVTLAKMAHVATQTILGRTSASTGDVEALTATQAKTVLGLSSTDGVTFDRIRVGTGVHWIDNSEDDLTIATGSLLDEVVWRFDHSAETITVNGNSFWTEGNDGPGSGLNADLLDGIQGSTYARLDQSNTFSSGITIDNVSPRLNLSESDTTTFSRIILDGSNLSIQAGASGQGSTSSSGNIRISGMNGTDIGSFVVRDNGVWNTVWHEGNGGASSGLDADLLDGVQGANYARTDVQETFGQRVNFIQPGSAFSASPLLARFEYQTGSGTRAMNIEGPDTNNATAPFRFATSNSFAFEVDTVDVFTVGNGGLISLTSGVGVTSILDEDTMSSNSATALATQQSIKAYVDANAGGGSFSGGEITSTIYTASPLSTFDAPGSPGTDTATDVGLAIQDGQRIAGIAGGFIRTLLKFDNGGDLQIGQGATTVIGGINLLPGTSGIAKVNGNEIWHAGNDGSGSGLDADLLDGVQGSNYARTDINENYTGRLTIDDGTSLPIILQRLASSAGVGIRFQNSQGYVELFADPTGTGTGELYLNGSAAFRLSGGLSAQGGIDTNGTDVYLSNGTLIAADSDGAFSARSGSNIDHIWHSEGDNTWHFCSDTTYKATGNSALQCGKIISGNWQGSSGASGQIVIDTGSADYVVRDTVTGGVANFIWRDHSASKLYLGTATAEVDMRSDCNVQGDITATGNITAYSSDVNLKENIIEISDPLVKINQIRGVEFDWKQELCKEVGFKPTNAHEHGVIAQEIEKIIPDAVDQSAFDPEYKAVRYDRIVPLLIEAIKELENRINTMENK